MGIHRTTGPALVTLVAAFALSSSAQAQSVDGVEAQVSTSTATGAVQSTVSTASTAVSAVENAVLTAAGSTLATATNVVQQVEVGADVGLTEPLGPGSTVGVSVHPQGAQPGVSAALPVGVSARRGNIGVTVAGATAGASVTDEGTGRCVSQRSERRRSGRSKARRRARAQARRRESSRRNCGVSTAKKVTVTAAAPQVSVRDVLGAVHVKVNIKA